MRLGREQAPYNPLMVLSSDDVRRVYEAIMESYPPVRIRDIARKLGETDDFVRRRVRRLIENGFRFQVDFSQQRIGLVNLCVYLKELYEPDPVTRIKGLPEAARWLLRWQVNTIVPKRIGILYFYVPQGREELQIVLDMIRERLKISKAVVMDVVIYSKPELWTLKFNKHNGSVVTDWDKIAESILAAYKSGEFPPIPREKPVSLDVVDVLILAFLQRNALTPLTKVAEAIGTSVSKVRRHLHYHLYRTRVIRGTMLSRYPARSQQTIYYYVTGRADPEAVALALSALRRTFEFRGAMMNSLTGDFSIIFAVNWETQDSFVRNMVYLSQVLGDYYTYILDPGSMKSYTIPFLMFSRESKAWSLETSVLEMMKHRLKSIIHM